MMIELVYVLYLESGYIKSILKGYNISTPIDITLLLAIFLVLFAIFYKISFNKKMFKNIYILTIFVVWMLISSFYTSSSEYWIHKVIYFGTNIIAFVIPILLYKKINIQKIYINFIILVTILNLIFVITILPYIYINESFHDVSGTYLATSLTSGLSILFIFINNVKIRNRFITNIFLVINFITLVASGGRGGLVFAIIILVLYLISKTSLTVITGKMSKKIFAGIFLVVFGVFATSIYYNIHKDEKENNILVRSINRLSLLEKFMSSKDGGESINTRVKYINFSLNKISENFGQIFFGYGIGSFGIEYNGIDEREYPHNILLEIWFEMGLIGLVIFLFFYINIFIHYKDKNMIWIMLYMILNVLKSSNLSDIRLLIAITVLYILQSNRGIFKWKD